MSIRDLYHRLIQSEIALVRSPEKPGGRVVEKADPKSWESISKFLIVAIQVGLLAMVIDQFQLINKAFYNSIMGLTFSGFLIHHFIPLQYRLLFFSLLSLAGILIVFGLTNSVWLIGIGLVLIGICHFPVSFLGRVVILVIFGAFLAVLRLGWIPGPWSGDIWPILGSMFMFRLIIYLYDLKNSQESVSIWRTLSYFFLLPNIIFPLFPVVDYSAFRRTYYDEDQYRIYQKGVEWMFRGVTHLILYRFVYLYLVISPEDVLTISDLVRYLISNFLIYLQVSGQFHLIVGMLHLFGFNLPETNHRYCLASSFTDFWRRINIYWKDFMMKVFYYPAYFRLRRWGTTTAMVLSTLFVFFVTWFLHAYQWFWLRGSFLLAWQDVLFWAILALLVIANSLYEAKYGRKRALGKRSWALRDTALLAMNTVMTFSVICILWSLWTSPSLSDWFSLWSVVGVSLEGVALLILTFLVAAVVFYRTLGVKQKAEKTQEQA